MCVCVCARARALLTPSKWQSKLIVYNFYDMVVAITPVWMNMKHSWKSNVAGNETSMIKSTARSQKKKNQSSNSTLRVEEELQQQHAEGRGRITATAR